MTSDHCEARFIKMSFESLPFLWGAITSSDLVQRLKSSHKALCVPRELLRGALSVTHIIIIIGRIHKHT